MGFIKQLLLVIVLCLCIFFNFSKRTYGVTNDNAQLSTSDIYALLSKWIGNDSTYNFLPDAKINSFDFALLIGYIQNNPISIEFQLTNQTDFPIAAPQVGQFSIECRGETNASNEWHIRQWNNEQSLCTATSQNTHPACVGASDTRSTSASRYCYFPQTKKFDLSINSNAMSYNGCFVHDDPTNLANTGGYSLYINWDSTKRSDFWTSDVFTLGKLDQLVLSAGFETAYLNSGTCPIGIVDPVIQTTRPIAFSYMSVTATEVDPTIRQGKNTIFYQVITYDNRPEKQVASDVYLDCGHELGTTETPNILISEPILVYDKPLAFPTNQDSVNGGLKQYSINILPQLIKYIRQCRGDVDLDNYKITSMYIGNELYNTTNMTNYVVDPKIKFVQK